MVALWKIETSGVYIQDDNGKFQSWGRILDDLKLQIGTSGEFWEKR